MPANSRWDLIRGFNGLIMELQQPHTARCCTTSQALINLTYMCGTVVVSPYNPTVLPYT